MHWSQFLAEYSEQNWAAAGAEQPYLVDLQSKDSEDLQSKDSEGGHQRGQAPVTPARLAGALQVKYGVERGRGSANVGPEKWPAIKSDGHFELSEQWMGKIRKILIQCNAPSLNMIPGNQESRLLLFVNFFPGLCKNSCPISSKLDLSGCILTCTNPLESRICHSSFTWRFLYTFSSAPSSLIHIFQTWPLRL